MRLPNCSGVVNSLSRTADLLGPGALATLYVVLQLQQEVEPVTLRKVADRRGLNNTGAIQVQFARLERAGLLGHTPVVGTTRDGVPTTRAGAGTTRACCRFIPVEDLGDDGNATVAFPFTADMGDYNRANEGPPPSAGWITPVEDAPSISVTVRDF